MTDLTTWLCRVAGFPIAFIGLYGLAILVMNRFNFKSHSDDTRNL